MFIEKNNCRTESDHNNSDQPEWTSQLFFSVTPVENHKFRKTKEKRVVLV